MKVMLKHRTIKKGEISTFFSHFERESDLYEIKKQIAQNDIILISSNGGVYEYCPDETYLEGAVRSFFGVMAWKGWNFENPKYKDKLKAMQSRLEEVMEEEGVYYVYSFTVDAETLNNQIDIVLTNRENLIAEED
jgi:hypothetical protein